MEQAGLVESQFVSETAPFPSCHASTIVQAADGHLVCAFFGGSKEGAKDVCIWASHFNAGRWTPPEQVADGNQPDRSRQPCWNPVLFAPRSGPLLLFYKV